MTKRTPSESTLKSRAMSAYFKAEAAWHAACASTQKAVDRQNKANAALDAARAECVKLGCPLPEPQP